MSDYGLQLCIVMLSVNPAFFENRTVDVRVGVHVQTLSNFQLTTMVGESERKYANASDLGLRHGHVVEK